MPHEARITFMRMTSKKRARRRGEAETVRSEAEKGNRESTTQRKYDTEKEKAKLVDDFFPDIFPHVACLPM